MKILLVTLILSTSIFANTVKLMHCLGEEEKNFHKDGEINHSYKLNQEIISALVQLNGLVALKPAHLKTVCAGDSKNTSFEILKIILVNKQSSFMVNGKKDTSNYNIAHKSLDEAYHRISDVFIDYLATIRAAAPRVNCIEDHIPQLKKFYESLLYLQEEMEREKILETISDLEGLFIKLEYVDSMYKKCKSEPKKQ